MKRRSYGLKRWLIRGCVLFLLTGPAVLAQESSERDLSEASIEELMEIKITVAAKREEALSQTAAAVFVITQEDIRRSGMTSIPEVLRLAPGVQVAQINGNSWAISIRGFNNRYANKLLVMVDGRAIYTPAFAGILWELLDMPLEDIERIEVVRGPGATLWGSNAVNGVINIITKHARETQGSLVSARGGSNGDAAVETRYGAHAAGDALFYRVYGKYSLWDRTPGLQDPGPRAYDGRDRLQSGFRADWSATPVNSLTFSGDIYRSSLEESWMAPMLVPPYSWQAGSEMKATGGNLRTRWLHRFSGGSESSAQIYYDHMDRLFPVIDLRQRTFGLDVQYHTALGRRNDVVAGGEYRRTGLGTRGTAAASLIPDHSVFSVFSGFIQDEVMLFPGRLWVTLGSKFESNSYTGLEPQPSVHLRWQPHSRHVMWAAVSRASRIPSYYEESARVGAMAFPGPAGIPFEGIVFGSQGRKAEQLLAYEVGYREQLHPRVSVDVATFYNTYDDLIYAKSETPFLEASPAPPHVVIPAVFRNDVGGRTYGLEVSTNYAPSSRWKVSGGYSWLRMRLDYPAALTLAPGDNPQHQFNVRSYLSLPRGFEFDNAVYYTSALAGQIVPRYTRLDTRLGWHANEGLEFSLAGQNLVDSSHPEFVQLFDIQGPAQVGRAVYGKVTWRF